MEPNQGHGPASFVTAGHNENDGAAAEGRTQDYYRPFILPLLLAICTLFYYFGELVNWAAWDALRLNFFYGIHDIHRLLFLAPIIYAGYTARIRGAIIITLVTFIIFLPRAFFISPYADPLLRMLLFTIIAGVIGVLTGAVRNKEEQYRHLEAALGKVKAGMLTIADGMADGILITDIDNRIRFMNTAMARDFGQGIGSTCYHLLCQRSSPCEQGCKIADVINKKSLERWQCRPADGRTYEVVASPYADADGTLCQLSVFRRVELPETSPHHPATGNFPGSP